MNCWELLAMVEVTSGKDSALYKKVLAECLEETERRLKLLPKLLDKNRTSVEGDVIHYPKINFGNPK